MRKEENTWEFTENEYENENNTQRTTSTTESDDIRETLVELVSGVSRLGIVTEEIVNKSRETRQGIRQLQRVTAELTSNIEGLSRATTYQQGLLNQQENRARNLTETVNATNEIVTTHQAEIEASQARESNLLNHIRLLEETVRQLTDQLNRRNNNEVNSNRNNSRVNNRNNRNRNRRNNNSNNRGAAANVSYQLGERIKIINWTQESERFAVVNAVRRGNVYFMFEGSRRRSWRAISNTRRAINR